MKIGACITLVHVLISLVAIFAVPDDSIDAFCSFEHLEATAECGQNCAVHESGAWFTAHPDFYQFSPQTVPGYSGAVVPIVPLCSNGSVSQKTFRALPSRVGVSVQDAETACRRNSAGAFGLASIASADENERARRACGDNCCWLGLQSAKALHWTTPDEWNDGARVNYVNWWPVNQPPKLEDPRFPQLYAFMNRPGAEPGERCSTLRIHMYCGVLVFLCFGGLSVSALVGANSLDGKHLNIAWRGWIGLWFLALIQSGVETSLYTDLNPFESTSWAWGFWAFTTFLVSAPLNAWWVISVRSLAGQCEDTTGVIQVANPLQKSSSVDNSSVSPASSRANAQGNPTTGKLVVANPLQMQSVDDSADQFSANTALAGDPTDVASMAAAVAAVDRSKENGMKQKKAPAPTRLDME
eukprot:COSAG02_NODE_2369_length_9049_cov_37.484358_1_plen_412_part_00